MSDTQDEQELVRRVAEGLGHEHVGNVFQYPLAGEVMYCDFKRWPFMAINFAAYAKAEMAKRGWYVMALHHPRWSRMTITRMSAGEGNRSMGGYYGPDDPVSEAMAVLRCVDAVLREGG